jgi:UDP-N-acetylglucosamine acyltransferase
MGHKVLSQQHLLYIRIFRYTKSLDIIGAEFAPTVERDEIIHFISNSQRGIMKGFGI